MYFLSAYTNLPAKHFMAVQENVQDDQRATVQHNVYRVSISSSGTSVELLVSETDLQCNSFVLAIYKQYDFDASDVNKILLTYLV